MADHTREDALLRIRDALLDVGCFLNRFEVDSIQCLSWKTHVYLANKSHSLPARRLQTARIGGKGTFVSAWDHTRGCVSFDGAQPEALQLALAAIKHSKLDFLSRGDRRSRSDSESSEPSLYCRLTHLSPATLHRLVFGFSSIEGLTLRQFNGNQLTEEHLRECGRKQIWRLYATTEAADAGPLAFSDEALLDYLLAPEPREVVLSAFCASPRFFHKLLSRAHTATDIRLEVERLPLASQQLGDLRLIGDEGFASYQEELENGVHIMLEFGWNRRFASTRRSEDRFSFVLSS